MKIIYKYSKKGKQINKQKIKNPKKFYELQKPINSNI